MCKHALCNTYHKICVSFPHWTYFSLFLWIHYSEAAWWGLASEQSFCLVQSFFQSRGSTFERYLRHYGGNTAVTIICCSLCCTVCRSYTGLCNCRWLQSSPFTTSRPRRRHYKQQSRGTALAEQRELRTKTLFGFVSLRCVSSARILKLHSSPITLKLPASWIVNTIFPNDRFTITSHCQVKRFGWGYHVIILDSKSSLFFSLYISLYISSENQHSSSPNPPTKDAFRRTENSKHS